MLSIVLLLAAAVAAGMLLLARQLRGAMLWWAGLAGQRTESELAGLFVFIPAARLLALTLALALLLAGAAAMLGAPWPVILATVIAALAMPRLWLRALRARRQARLALQVPDALALWAGLLRAGQSSQQALGQVAQRQSAPLGEELRLVLGQLRMGVTLEAAMESLRERVPLGDLRLLSTLLATQREIGGNLAESLQRLADTLRARQQMEARIVALTAQGRMQGLVVGVLPLLLLAALYVMEPEAMRVLHTSWQGWVALGAIAVLELVGFLLIRRIVRIEV